MSTTKGRWGRAAMFWVESLCRGTRLKPSFGCFRDAGIAGIGLVLLAVGIAGLPTSAHGQDDSPVRYALAPKEAATTDQPNQDRPACTSPYFQPREGVLYRYGNFCGPAWPVSEGDPNNAETLRAGLPQDDIDLLCKAHDLCFAEYGADNTYCDELGGVSATFATSADEPDLEYQCDNVLMEIFVALYVKPKSNTEDTVTSAAATVIGSPLLASLGGIQCFSVRLSGFPERSGQCFLKDDRRRQKFNREIRKILANARASHECGTSSVYNGCFRQRSLAYREEISLDSFLGLDRTTP